MQLETIGDSLLARDEHGQLRSRIATIFPRTATLVTLPGIHASQRVAYVEALNRKRLAVGQPPLTEKEQEDEWLHGVDLILEDSVILIRPDPDRMELAFQADEMLQQVASKKRIRFLHVLDQRVRDAIKRRGEAWRINPLPRSPVQMKQMIAASRIGISGRELYYYNKAAGTRLLTLPTFCSLEMLADDELRQYLGEIRQYSLRRNSRGNPEVEFFMAEGLSLAAEFAAFDFAAVDSTQLRNAYNTLCGRFTEAVPPEFRRDDLDSALWRSRMYAALIGQTDKSVTEESLLGLSAEFFMQVEWLPGGYIAEGELILDSVFEEEAAEAGGPADRRICDDKARRFIFNFIRDYGDLEYVNIGKVIVSLSQRPPGEGGRRDVYLAEIKQDGMEQPILRILRMQKWGVWEHLDEGKGLLAAILESDDYTEYILDRRMGCRQLGMNLPARVTARKINERYCGHNRDYQGMIIRSPYFDREYIRGVATDKIPHCQFHDEAFATSFARLLGRAAAPNLIVGRCDLQGGIIFDDGDELLIENEQGLPVDLLVSDHTGTFMDYRRDLRQTAGEYARSITARAGFLANVPAFRDSFLDAFVERFTQIQKEYLRRRRAFDTLFKHQQRDEAGSFAFRWERVLARLQSSCPRELAELIRKNVK